MNLITEIKLELTAELQKLNLRNIFLTQLVGTKWDFVGNGDMGYLGRAKELKKEADVLANKKVDQAIKYLRAVIFFYSKR